MFRKMVNASVRLVQRYLPEPFIFALLLTFIAFAVAIPVCKQTPLEVLNNWGNGVWGLLAFSMQMALVLVCGSTLADAPAVKRGLDKLASMPKRPVGAIALVSLVSALACWINWGFGLIIGVVFAKSIARKMRGVDYRLLIASAYSGFVVWHGGISGSIPLALATPGAALSTVTMGVVTEPIAIGNTILSPYNLGICLFVIIALVVANSLMHPKGKEVVEVDPGLLEEEEDENNSFKPSTPAEKAENSIVISMIIALMGFAFLVMKLFVRGESGCMVYVDTIGRIKPLYLKDFQDPKTGKIPPRRVDIEGDQAQGIYKHIVQYITPNDYEAAREYLSNPEEYDFYKILNW